MILGANYTQGASGFEIVQPKDSFRANDSLAFVVSLDQSFGTTQVMVILAREGAGGAEFTVNSSPMTIANPDFTQLAGRLPTKALMGVSPAGTYKLEISDGSSILAEATFHYLG